MSRLIYLHGFASGPSSGKAQHFRRKFAEHGVDLAIPDLAAGDFEHLTVSGQLAVIEQAAGTGPVALIGSSLGGYLAALYASRHLEVTRLVLLAPAFGFARRWPESLGRERMEEWRLAGSLEIYHYAMNRTAKLDYSLIEDGMLYEDFPDFRQPALIYHGEQDDVVPAALSREFVATHSNAQLEVLPSSHELLDVLDPIWTGMWNFLQPAIGR